jgi:hypothetical protein
VLKFSVEKIKISLTDDGEPWEIKVKLNKAKLRKDGNELFAAKHYPDTGKLKVKTAKGVTVLESHDFKKVSAAPLGLYIPDYDEDHRKLVLLALLARQR